jgi:sugar/nucleoside kinase (ribokinase family)
MMRRIVVAGHVCADLRPSIGATRAIEPGRLVEIGPLGITLGGCVGNTAGDLAALGAPVRAVGWIGDDDLGELVRLRLNANELVETDLTVAPGYSTSYSVVLEPTGADRTFWHHVGANGAFDGSGVDLTGADILHLGYPTLLPAMYADGGSRLSELLSGAHAAGVTTSVDLAVVDPDAAAGAVDWRAILGRAAPHVDIMTPSLDDLLSALHIDEPFSEELVDRLADLLLDWGVAIAAISAGAHGLFVRASSHERLAAAGRALALGAADWAGARLTLPPISMKASATTNGAGDAAAAGLLFGINAGLGPELAGQLAVACSAVIIGGGETTRDAVLALNPDLDRAFANNGTN